MKIKARLLGPAVLALMFALMLMPLAAFAQGSGVNDYDTDDDGLIEVNSVAQLKAIQYDLNGNGIPAGLSAAQDSAARSKYYGAFPNPINNGMGCPAANHDNNPDTPDQPTCRGYELTGNIDLDGVSWEPLGIGLPGANDVGYSGILYGNGHRIHNLTLSWDGGNVGLFSTLSGRGVIDGIHLVDPQITSLQDATVTEIAVGALVARNLGIVGSSSVIDDPGTTRRATMAAHRNNTDMGALVGYNAGGVRASFMEGVYLEYHRQSTRVGGLVGFNAGEVSASYARGGKVTSNVATASTSNTGSGGLVGWNSGNGGHLAAIIDSYAAVDLAAGPASELYGRLTAACYAGHSRIVESYYSSDVQTQSDPDATGSAESPCGVPKTNVELKAPTSYTGIYVNWHRPLDLNGDGYDDTAGAWHFGTSDQWPTIRARDLDDDNDGLIEIGSLAQLAAIRYDPNGDGQPLHAAWSAAFATGQISGCPSAGCRGYELVANLDFDTDRDGSTWTRAADGTVTLDSGDDYYNRGKGWNPVQFGYGWSKSPTGAIATFDGNGHVIANLVIDRTGDVDGQWTRFRNYGLFDLIGHDAVVRNVGVVHAYVAGPNNPSGAYVSEHVGGVGILAGAMNGSARVEAVWIMGEVQGSNWTGGMIGRNDGQIVASSVQAQVKSVGTPAENTHAGGAVGLQNEHGYIHSSFALGGSVDSTGGAGGLVGKTRQGSRIVNSYAAVPLRGYERGGLVGSDEGGGYLGVRNSYWDAWLADYHDSDGGTPSNTYEMTRTAIGQEDGIYEHWNELPPGLPAGTRLWTTNPYPLVVYEGIDAKWGGANEAVLHDRAKVWAAAAEDQLQVHTNWNARVRSGSSNPDVLSGSWQWQESDNGVDGWTNARLQRIAGSYRYQVGADRYGKYLRARVLKRPREYPATYPEVTWYTHTIRIMAISSNHHWYTTIAPAPQVGVESTFGTQGRKDSLGLTGSGEKVERWVLQKCDDSNMTQNCVTLNPVPRQWTPAADDEGKYVKVTAFWRDPRPQYAGLFQAQYHNNSTGPIRAAAPANPPSGN